MYILCIENKEYSQRELKNIVRSLTYYDYCVSRCDAVKRVQGESDLVSVLNLSTLSRNYGAGYGSYKNSATIGRMFGHELCIMRTQDNLTRLDKEIEEGGDPDCSYLSRSRFKTADGKHNYFYRVIIECEERYINFDENGKIKIYKSREEAENTDLSSDLYKKSNKEKQSELKDFAIKLLLDNSPSGNLIFIKIPDKSL